MEIDGDKVGIVLSRSDAEANAVVLATRMEKYAVITSPSSLRLRSALSFENYTDMIRDLSVAIEAGSRYDTQVKFMIADALNQGEEVYGENWAQIFGDSLNFSYRYMRNIMWVGRAFDPDIRCMRVSFKVHYLLAGYSRGDQERYIRIAEDLHDRHPSDYNKRLRELINDEKIEQIVSAMTNEDLKQQILDVLGYRKASWQMVKRWANGLTPVPGKHQVIENVIDELISIYVHELGFSPETAELVGRDILKVARGVDSKRIAMSQRID